MSRNHDNIVCAVELTLNIIGGKWKGVIMWHFFEYKTLRFSEIMSIVSEGIGEEKTTISKRMLSKQLREMEEDGLITKEVFAEVPPKVEYTITDKGESLKEILLLAYDWGENEQRQRRAEKKLAFA
jgi:DNA-binding HxlR family transcriptional regulator